MVVTISCWDCNHPNNMTVFLIVIRIVCVCACERNSFRCSILLTICCFTHPVLQMAHSKLILTRYEQAVCRVHFILVGSIISFIFTVMGTVVSATKWYHFSLPLCSLLVTLVTFYSAWTLHIRALVTSAVLNFLDLAFKVVSLVLLSTTRNNIFQTCYLYGDANCQYEDWELAIVTLADSIAFIFPSTVVSFISLAMLIYLVYIFRNVTR